MIMWLLQTFTPMVHQLTVAGWLGKYQVALLAQGPAERLLG
jgi:hypothetical protein